MNKRILLCTSRLEQTCWLLNLEGNLQWKEVLPQKQSLTAHHHICKQDATFVMNTMSSSLKIIQNQPLQWLISSYSLFNASYIMPDWNEDCKQSKILELVQDARSTSIGYFSIWVKIDTGAENSQDKMCHTTMANAKWLIWKMSETYHRKEIERTPILNFYVDRYKTTSQQYFFD